MPFVVIGCILCGAREAAEAYRPWCPNNTGFNPELTCNLCREFERLQDQIKETSQHLIRLLERRHQLNTRISLYHRNNPLQRIPPEILSNIFQFFISSKSDCSPLKLGAICGGWRAIAWSTPRLWNCISINFDTSSSLSKKIQLTREWLSRSGQLPLSITIEQEISRDLPPLSVSLLSALVHVINGYANRWKDLDVSLPPQTLPLFHAYPHGKSILHSLKIDPGISPFQPTRVSETFNPKSPCPRPTVVEILSVHFQSIRISWDKVTHLDVSDFSEDECFEVLRQAPSLMNCRFTAINLNENRFPFPEGLLSHPNLTSLHVGLSRPGIFFEPLSFPSLQFLSVQVYYTPLPTEELVPFLRRSSSLLHELHLSFQNEDPESVIQILNETPSLTKLHLEALMDDDLDHYNPIPLFQRLADPSSTLGDNGTKFLPRLETMCYIGTWCFPWDSIPKIFGATWRPLSNFRLHCHELLGEDSLPDMLIDETTLSQIQELDRRGISIEIMDADLRADFLKFSRQWLTSGPLDIDDFLAEN